MKPLMSIIRLLCSLWERNFILLEERSQLVYLLLHTLVFKVKTPHIIGTHLVFKLLLFLRARGSFRSLLILFRILTLRSPFSFRFGRVYHYEILTFGGLDDSHLDQLLLFLD